MSIDDTTSTVVFAHRFTLPGLNRTYPAGAYLITTENERLDVSFSATRRVATRIALTRGATTEYVAIEPSDLAAALAADAATPPG